MLANVIYKLYNIISGWAILQRNQDTKKVKKGVERLNMVIREAYARSHG
jgi:hypothetical protein